MERVSVNIDLRDDRTGGVNLSGRNTPLDHGGSRSRTGQHTFSTFSKATYSPCASFIIFWKHGISKWQLRYVGASKYLDAVNDGKSTAIIDLSDIPGVEPALFVQCLFCTLFIWVSLAG